MYNSVLCLLCSLYSTFIIYSSPRPHTPVPSYVTSCTPTPALPFRSTPFPFNAASTPCSTATRNASASFRVRAPPSRHAHVKR